MGGDTLTNLQLGDANSSSTIVRVKVEAGSGPLMIFLHSESPVIWDFEGAVEQVDSAIIVTRDGKQRVASRGLPERVIKFPDLAGCPWVILPPSMKPREDENNVERYFGRPADRTAFQGKPKMLKLPEGEFVLTQELPNAKTNTERELLMYHPGGFRMIDVKSVVSPVTVLEPETPPGEAGLIQLENAGAIRPPQRSEIDGFIEGLRQRQPSTNIAVLRANVSVDYVVTREIMLPPELTGSHLKNFLVLPGVPMPRGNAGHGCLMFMDGYRTNDSSYCSSLLRQ